MTTARSTEPEDAVALRQQAEEFARKNAAMTPPDPADLSPEAIRQALHELRVHQIELEMQNEELRQTQVALEAARAQYFDFYDMAPVGYLTVSEKNMILDANLTATSLLGVTRSALVKHPVNRFILKEDHDVYYRHHQQLAESGTPQTCELRLLKSDGTIFWAQLAASIAQDSSACSGQAAGGAPVCRLVVSDITERRRAQEALQESEQTFRGHVVNSFDIIFTLDSDGKFIFISPAWERCFGYPVSAALGKSFALFVHPDELAPLVKYLKRVLLTGQGETSPAYRVKHANGHWLWFVANGALYVTANGARQFIGVGHDITERRRVEESLREANAYLDNLFNYANAPIIVWNPQFKITRFNHAFEFLTGRSATKVIGQSLELLFPPAMVERSMALIKETQSGERWESVEIAVQHRDGHVRTLLWNSATLFAVDRKTIVATIAQGQDITERIRAEVELRQSKDRFELAINATEDGVWEWDIQTNQEFCTPRYCEIVGYTVDDPEFPHVFQSWSSRIHPDDYERVMAALNNHLYHGAKYDVDYRHRHKSGEYRWQRAKGQAVFDAQGAPVKMVGCISDITERMHAVEAILNTKEELEQAQNKLHAARQSERLAFTGRIAASIAHEIRNPSTTVSLALGQLRGSLVLQGKQAEYIEIIEKNIHRINTLITEMLNCARPPELDIQQHDLHEILDAVISSVEMKMAAKKIHLVKQFTTADAVVHVDKEHIGRALLNLIINAIDAMAKKGGILTIATENNGVNFQINIHDTGKGIPADDLIKIFDPFFSTKPLGVGLGLTTCYGVVVSHGGTIDVASKVAKGTTFTVALPI
ncbi:MAG: PAS domain S-box protein [bacterium]|nr:PAS domain S-box protein [bacterium]